MRQIFTFVRMGWWNIIQARMLHRSNLIIRERNQFFYSIETIQSTKLITVQLVLSLELVSVTHGA